MSQGHRGSKEPSLRSAQIADPQNYMLRKKKKKARGLGRVFFKPLNFVAFWFYTNNVTDT